MSTDTDRHAALPPVTLEGWYIAHQMYSLDRLALRQLDTDERGAMQDEFIEVVDSLASPAEGWTRLVLLTGARTDLMVIHTRPTLDTLGHAQRALQATHLASLLRLDDSFLSVAEAGMYALIAKLAKSTRERGGEIGDEQYAAELADQLEEGRNTAHVRQRLYPSPPDQSMPYVCFYPMSKRRAPSQNWYELSAEDRSRLMWEHGKSGRRHAGRIRQIVSGAIGLDEWEWGVTLFGVDPVAFKKAVTEMRFDEVSARYAEFGRFYVGRVVGALALVESICGAVSQK